MFQLEIGRLQEPEVNFAAINILPHSLIDCGSIVIYCLNLSQTYSVRPSANDGLKPWS